MPKESIFHPENALDLQQKVIQKIKRVQKEKGIPGLKGTYVDPRRLLFSRRETSK